MVLGISSKEPFTFRRRGFHPLWRTFPCPSARKTVFDSPAPLQGNQDEPHNPNQATLAGLAPDRFGLFRVRSPLLTESQLLSLPQGTEMVHFPWLASLELCIHSKMTGHYPCRVTPFGNPRIKRLLAAPRGLSQLATSFIASLRQGIHRAPLVA